MADEPDQKLQRIIAHVDSSISEFRREATSVQRYNSALAEEMEAASREHIESFANGLKLAITTSAEATSSLTQLNVRIYTDRVRYLSHFLQDSIPRIRRKLFSPFWLGSQQNVLTDLDQVEKGIDGHNLRQMSQTDRLDRLKASFQKVEDILTQLEQDRQVSKRRVPIKTLLWGVPIWLGILLSGRFRLTGNLITFLVLIAAVIVSFVLANRRTLTFIRRTSKAGRIRRNWISILRRDWTLQMAALVVLAGVVGLLVSLYQSRSVAAAFLSKDPANISLATQFEAKPGDELHIPITISSPSQAVYQVRIEVSSPIIEIQKPGYAKVIGATPIIVPLNAQVLNDVPPGSFPATVTISYSTKSTSFLYSGFISKTRQTPIELLIR
jgi:hypothetical protein